MERRDVLKLLGLASPGGPRGWRSLSSCQAGPRADPGARDQGQVRYLRSETKRVAGDPSGGCRAVVEALQRTGGRLYGAVATADGNLAISPYSVLVALALTLNGAAGQTQQQLVDLYGGADVDTINAGLNTITSAIDAESGPAQKADGTDTEVVLETANALFGQEDVRFGQAFLDTLAEQYGAGMQAVDYRNEPEAAREAVNAWTAERTRDKIPEILGDGAVDDLTRLVLVNTVYLKAPWERPFEPSATTAEPFTLLDGSTVEVDLMQSLGPIAQAAVVADGWQGVRLAYAGGGLAMTVVLPEEGRFADVEADLVATGVGAYLDALEPTPAIVRLPRWTFRTQAPLVGALQSLGVEDAFEPGRADLSPMTTEEELFISAVAHEVFIAVDEEGTEAAAATAVVAGATSAPVDLLDFVADRPFLFCIHDVELGTPLFLGRVVDPRS